MHRLLHHNRKGKKAIILFPRKVVFLVNVSLLLKLVIPHPNPCISLNDSHAHWVCEKFVICQSNACVAYTKCSTKVPWKNT